MLPTPIGVLDAPLLGRAPPFSASCADHPRHPRVAASDVFPGEGNSRERARACAWLILASQSMRSELEGRVRGHMNSGTSCCGAVFRVDPGNTNRVTMVVVLAPHVWGGGQRRHRDATPRAGQYKDGRKIVKSPVALCQPPVEMSPESRQ
jgi:hypothetical protein